VRLVGVGLGPDETDKDRPAVERVLGVELADAILKLSDLRNYDVAILGIRPIEVPEVSLRIVGAQSEPLDMSGRAVGLELLDLGASIP